LSFGIRPRGGLVIDVLRNFVVAVKKCGHDGAGWAITPQHHVDHPPYGAAAIAVEFAAFTVANNPL
jgi:hypothetical protein